VEILAALKKLGETLSPAESEFLEKHRSQALSDFEKFDTAVGQSAQALLSFSFAPCQQKDRI
jgi:hypothetical protein